MNRLAAPGHIAFWFRTEQLVAADGPYTAMIAYGAGDTREWSLRFTLASGATNLDLYSRSDSLVATMATAVNDGRWRRVVIYDDSPSLTIWSVLAEGDDTATDGNCSPSTMTIVDTNVIIVGGRASVSTNGKQSSCPTWQFGGLVVSEDPPSPDTSTYAGPGFSSPVALSTWDAALSDWVGVAPPTVVGSDDGTVAVPNVIGSTYWTARAKAARSNGAIAWVNPAGTPELRLPDAVRTATPVLTLDMEADGSGLLEVSRQVDSIPTRVTVSFPDGEVTVIDAAAEVDGTSREQSFDTAARDESQAQAVAEFTLLESDGLRINKVGIALHSAVNDLYAQAWALYPGARVRLTNLPSTFFGVTQADVIVQGWTETYALDGVYFEMDTTPADSPRQGLADTDRVGATDTTLTSTITSSSTALSFTIGASGETWTVTAGDYPMKVKMTARS